MPINVFNQDLSNWDVSSVLNMSNMFRLMTLFNAPLNWGNKTGNVTTMQDMFRDSPLFNQDIGGWDVSNVTRMDYMFFNARNFNQNIGAWNVSKVSNMFVMFQSCILFNQDLGNWDISAVTNARNMFLGLNLCRANYGSILQGWSTLSTGETRVPINLNVSFGTSKYSDSPAVVAARAVLTGSKNWVISDGGVESDYVPPAISALIDLAANNATVAVTFDTRVYNNCNGTANIDVADFVVSVSGGAAVLASPTPISITTSNNITFTIGISYSTVANGSETLTISPALNSIFDFQGNDMSISQSNNTVLLNDLTAPTITGPGPSTASTSSMSVNENGTSVVTFSASETVTWSLGTTNDEALFVLNSSGILTFKTAPDYEAPTDTDTNNTYIIDVIATDATGLTTPQSLTITVNDVFDLPATLSAFNNITKYYLDSSHTLVAPTSNNSTGAFTYTSSDTNVATIVGTTVNFIAPGTTTITATQLSDGNYIQTDIAAILTITGVSVLTKSGGISTTNPNYVNKNGGIGTGIALSANGAILTVKTPPPAIGDYRFGGVVFWIDPADDTHGLVCAIHDQSTGIRWFNGTTQVTGATATNIGTGAANTDAIILVQGVTATNYAAGLARAYKSGFYGDWFLPSMDELLLMWSKRLVINTTSVANGGDPLSPGPIEYWSSSEAYDTHAKFLSNGRMQLNWKNGPKYVRAIRSF
jgi:surface protein